MQLTRWDPFREMEEMFGQRGRGWLSKKRSGTTPFDDESWMPSVDISETDKSFLIKVEVPGIKRDDVKISIEDNTLTIRGERKEEKKEEGRKYHRMECSYGSFERQFMLPPNINQEKIDASFKDGVLALDLPKKEVEKPKQVEVKIK